MTPHLLIDALGTTVAIDCEGLEDEDAHALAQIWRDALIHPVEGGARESGTTPVVRALPPASSDAYDFAQLASRLSQAVTLAAIRARKGDFWMLHAAGIADRDGRVIVLVGPSGRGKTTASHTLSEHFWYVSDETVGIAADGSVYPYRKPLSLIENHGAPKTQRAVSSLTQGPARPQAALTLAAVVLLDRYENDEGISGVRHVPLSEALGDLAEQSSYLTLMDAPLRTMAEVTERTGGVRVVSYQGREELVPLIRDIFADRRPPVRHAEPVIVGASASDSGWHRLPAHDALLLPERGELALLHGQPGEKASVHVLAGIAPELWLRADGRSIDALTAAVISAHGPSGAGDEQDHIASILNELAQIGVVENRDARGAAGSVAPV